MVGVLIEHFCMCRLMSLIILHSTRMTSGKKLTDVLGKTSEKTYLSITTHAIYRQVAAAVGVVQDKSN
ncbi:hypothetical protein GJV44_00671 [Candidatus Vallotia cooleyia]|nr:hypothetical protein GJV44_00671 [Candidatus Vallotia cooleyia]